MKIVILGTGYVGLITGVCLASKGHKVICVDLKKSIVDNLNNCTAHIYEKGLSELLQSVVASGNFNASLDLNKSLEGAEIVMIAVGTPSTYGVIDLSYISNAAVQIGHYIKSSKKFISIIVKSTVIPGTTDSLIKNILEKETGLIIGGFGLGMNPEFLREGNAIEDFMNPDRIVFGYEDKKTLNLLEELYSPWNCTKLAVNSRTAELIKYANNCLLATQISAVNEIANLASSLGGIDVIDVMKGVHLDKRWSPVLPNGKRIRPDILSYQMPGCGFGGSCFPKDVAALRSQGKSLGESMAILDAVLSVNEKQPNQIITILKKFSEDLSGKKALILGLAFKPDTDDVRESASRKIISDLLDNCIKVTIHDPVAIENALRSWPEINQVEHTDFWETILPFTDIIIIATKWDSYLSLKKFASTDVLKGKIIIDPRRLFQPSDFPDSNYLSIGYTK